MVSVKMLMKLVSTTSKEANFSESFGGYGSYSEELGGF